MKKLGDLGVEWMAEQEPDGFAVLFRERKESRIVLCCVLVVWERSECKWAMQPGLSALT